MVNKLIIITHKDIIPEIYLPTFNSLCIELYLYNIPNLSNNFIYFNDDMIVLDNYEFLNHLNYVYHTNKCILYLSK